MEQSVKATTKRNGSNGGSNGATGTENSRTFLSKFDRQRFSKLNEEMSWGDYFDRVLTRPALAYSAYQRLYNMIISSGWDNSERYRKTMTHYKFFDDDEIPVVGLEKTISRLVQHIKAAAGYYGTERRILLLHGPVGSAKSTICRRLKRGMEQYSRTDEGAIYTFTWTNIGHLDVKKESPCPMNDDPLKLIPVEMRPELLVKLNAVNEEQYGKFNDKEKDKVKRELFHPLKLIGELNPHCKYYMRELLKQYEGDLNEVLEKHIKIRRIVLSEADRIGIGTFQPKDSKNQDSTELTGDTDYLKLGQYGVDSDPRAFSFDGEFEIANRGFLEFIEMLKLDKEFLYDLLGVCQERQFKPKKFPQIDVDLVLFSHTNLPDAERLRADNSMEALRDRTVQVNVPYLTEWNQEIRVLDHDYGKDKVGKKTHVAPHTVEIAALWAILTRLTSDKDNKITLVEKAKLYNGQVLPGWSEDSVKELRDKYPDEGMKRGVSARYVQNAISNALVNNPGYVNPFMVMNELLEKLDFMMIDDKNQVDHYRTCINYARKELDEILKKEVQMALVADHNAIERLFTAYIDNVVAHCEKAKIRNPYTQQEVEPDERLMRSIEEKADVPEQMADEFRRQIAEFIGRQSFKKKEVKWDSNAKLARALERKLFEDTKDHIKLSKLSNSATQVDPELQQKIDAIKTRLVKQYGYNEDSATDVLNYVSSIFSRGDLIEE